MKKKIILCLIVWVIGTVAALPAAFRHVGNQQILVAMVWPLWVPVGMMDLLWVNAIDPRFRP